MLCKFCPQPRAWLALGSVLLVSTLGCGGGSASVQGSITLDGQPLDGGRVFFLPEGDPKGRPTVEVKIQGGKYCLPAKLGLKPGKHRVEIVWHQPPPGKEHLQPGDPGFTTDNWVQTVPAAYNRDTTLFEDVKAGPNELDFALTKSP